MLGGLKNGSLGKFYQEERGVGGELAALSRRQGAIEDLRVKIDWTHFAAINDTNGDDGELTCLN